MPGKPAESIRGKCAASAAGWKMEVAGEGLLTRPRFSLDSAKCQQKNLGVGNFRFPDSVKSHGRICLPRHQMSPNKKTTGHVQRVNVARGESCSGCPGHFDQADLSQTEINELGTGC